jgi:hypothetical protein
MALSGSPCHPSPQATTRASARPVSKIGSASHAYLDESVNFGARVSSANGFSAGSFDRDNSEIQFDDDDAIPQFR